MFDKLVHAPRFDLDEHPLFVVSYFCGFNRTFIFSGHTQIKSSLTILIADITLKRELPVSQNRKTCFKIEKRKQILTFSLS
jgi:hypothetical protein